MKIKNIFGNLRLEGTDAAIVKEHISDTVLMLITLFFTFISEKMSFHDAMEKLMYNAGPEGIVPASSVKIRCLLFANRRRDLFDDKKPLLNDGDTYEDDYGETRVSLIRKVGVNDKGSYFVGIEMAGLGTETGMRLVHESVFADEKEAIDDFANTLELRAIFLKVQRSVVEM